MSPQMDEIITKRGSNPNNVPTPIGWYKEPKTGFDFHFNYDSMIYQGFTLCGGLLEVNVKASHIVPYWGVLKGTHPYI